MCSSDLGALAPFKDLGVAGAVATTSRAIAGTDSTSFNNAGLPGIGLSQDPFDYGTFTHHTSYDTLERIYEPDVREAAVEEALAAYALAMSDQMLPRCSAATMPPPPPEPAGRAGAGRGTVPVTPVQEVYGPPLAPGQTTPAPPESCAASAPSASAKMKSGR